MSTKIHALTEAGGNLVHFRLTGGQAGDNPEAKPLLEGITAEGVAADKAYDSDELVLTIELMGAEVVIPSKSNRKVQRAHDKVAYKLRNRIERFFCRLKHFRRIATRYDKLARRFASFILVVAATFYAV